MKKEQQEQEEKYDLESPDFRHDFYAPGHHQERDQAEALQYRVAKFLLPYWEDNVDFDIWLSYQPASLCSRTGRYDNIMS